MTTGSQLGQQLLDVAAQASGERRTWLLQLAAKAGAQPAEPPAPVAADGDGRDAELAAEIRAQAGASRQAPPSFGDEDLAAEPLPSWAGDEPSDPAGAEVAEDDTADGGQDGRAEGEISRDALRDLAEALRAAGMRVGEVE